MTLDFEPRREYGHTRYYPMNQAARGVASVVGKKTLTPSEVEILEQAGFTINLTGEESPEVPRYEKT